MLSLGEGGTPLRREKWLAEWAGIDAVWVKREDLNPTGSHKDRGRGRRWRRARQAVTAWR